MSPKLPTKAQAQWLHEKDLKFALWLDNEDLKYEDITVFYNCIYIPAIRYTLPMSSLNQRQIQEATKLSKKKFLNKLGLSSTTATEVVTGSTKWGGLGLKDIYVEEGLANIQMLMNAIISQSKLKNMVMSNIETWTWHTGTGIHPLAVKYKPTYDETVWLSQIKTFTTEHNIELRFTSKNFPLLRDNDRYIMEIVAEGNWPKCEKRYINFCRLFLGVISLADITDPSGNYIIPEAMKFKNAN